MVEARDAFTCVGSAIWNPTGCQAERLKGLVSLLPYEKSCTAKDTRG